MLNDSVWWRMEEQRRKLETKIEFKKGVVSKGEAGMRHLLAWAEGIVVQNVKMSIRSLGRSTLFLVSILSPRPRDRPLARNCTFSRSRAPILLFFFPPPLPSFFLFLSFSRRFFSSSRRHSKEGTGNGSPLLILRHTAEIFEVLFFVPSTVISSSRWRSSLSLAS